MTSILGEFEPLATARLPFFGIASPEEGVVGFSVPEMLDCHYPLSTDAVFSPAAGRLAADMDAGNRGFRFGGRVHVSGGDNVERKRANSVAPLEGRVSSEVVRVSGAGVGGFGAGGCRGSGVGTGEVSEGVLGRGSKAFNGFERGDMVWGKVESYPWWPGSIMDEALARPSVLRTKVEGFVLVAFYGDDSYGWFNPAELLPFEPHFHEMYTQANSRNFVKAVEDAVDEVGRREGLGLACLCRNPSNFRPASVPGLLAVDFGGDEGGGFYSARQIEKARESFIPIDALRCLSRLAVTPHVAESGSIDWIKSKGRLFALRRAMFQEFDDTYAEAFGVQPVRPSRNAQNVSQHAASLALAPKAAPATGPLVVAEAIGEKKAATPTTTTTTNATKEKPKSGHPLKRRDGAPPPTLPSAFSTAPQESKCAAASIGPAGKALSAASYPAGKHAVQRKTTPAVAGKRQQQQTTAPKREDGAAASKGLPSSNPGKDKVEILRIREGSSNGPRNVGSELPDALEEKAKRRKRKELDGSGGNGRPTARNHPRLQKTGVSPLPKSPPKPLASAPVHLPSPNPPADSLPAKLDSGTAGLLLRSLKSLAMGILPDPDDGCSAVVMRVFLRLRSLTQSTLPPPASDLDAPEAMKPPSVEGPDCLMKSGQKRPLSDRQEEVSAKKMRRMVHIKSLASEKKEAVLAQKKPKDAPKKRKEGPAASPARPPVPPEETAPASPTYLFMKFPRTMQLPSVSLLKARFARFGSLDPSGVRVYWETYTCKVLFKRRMDAQAAHDHVAAKSAVVGEAKVVCTLREVETRATAPEVRKPSDNNQQQQPVQLKSCLKKRPGDVTGAVAPNEGSGARSPLETAAVTGSGATCSIPTTTSSPHTATRDPINPNSLEPVRLANTRPPLLPFPAVSGGRSATPGLANIRPPLLPFPAVSGGGSAPRPPPRPIIPVPGAQEPWRGGRDSSNAQRHRHHQGSKYGKRVDISREMLDLMRKCDSVVTNLQSALGYLPYHTL